MIKHRSIFYGLLCLSFTFECAEKSDSSSKNQVLVAFYNVDNLYDTINDPMTFDDEFTPQGKNHWNAYKYQQKLNHLSQVLNDFEANQFPDILGVCEIENKKVLLDLALKMPLASYNNVHYDSKDERGIDVALFYNKDKFSVLDSKNYTPKFSKDTADKTRDVLWVKLLQTQSKDTFQFLVCHFPSRREGQAISEPKRVEVAQLCKKIIKEKCNPQTQNLIMMGDFNDEPFNQSLAITMGAKELKKFPNADLSNLMFEFVQSKKGSYRYKNQWNVLDQFILSNRLINSQSTHYLSNSVFIKDDRWLFQKGKFAEFPHRTFAGNKWLNGYSDHLPIGFRIQLNDKKKD